jgi:hypothetical protein
MARQQVCLQNGTRLLPDYPQFLLDHPEGLAPGTHLRN